ncbi:glycosyltransferase family 39 protein, partial [Candidatus Daviesbacteria bacterium]|nr:glycosyltransferase family 39 protein [Candidatus Daviesbacteria bacterium]
MKFTPYSLTFLILLIFALVLRLNRLDFPLSNTFVWGDGTRDYLVANHILKYGEFPLLGPYNLLLDYGIQTNSPLYFYLLALFLIPFNNVLTLGLVNILWQILVIVLIYLISKRLFNQITALVSVVLFSINPQVLNQSDYIWQPHLMQPIAYLGLFFLIKSFFSGSYPKLLLSIFLICLAITIHYSAFPWLPLFLVASLWILNRNHKSAKHYLGVVMVLVVPIILFHLPVFLYQVVPPDLDGIIYTNFGKQYLFNLSSNFNELLNAFGLKDFLPLLIVGSIICFLFIRDQKHQKFTVITLIFLISPIILASFFDKIRLHYLTLSFGILSIFVAKIITSVPNIRWFILVNILLFLLFFKAFSADFNFLSNTRKPLDNLRQMEEMSTQLKAELTQLREDQSYRDFGFFQIRSYAVLDNEAFDYPVLDTILLVNLEERLNQKLTKIVDSAYNHIQIGDDQYLLVSCFNFAKMKDEVRCLKAFTIQQSRHSIVKKLYDGDFVSVYLSQIIEDIYNFFNLSSFHNILA